MYDVKHGECQKAPLVADGNLNIIPVKHVYYELVSFHVIWLIVLISKINDMEMWDKYIVNAYLEANTLDKVYIILGTDFGEMEGHILIFPKNYTAFDFMAFNSMRGFLIVSEIW